MSEDAEPIRRCPLTERCTDAYLIIMLLIFPLFPGFSGYAEITLSKYLFFVAATGLWAVESAFFLLREKPALRFGFPQWMALGYLTVCTLSLLFSPYRASALIGAGPYDGFLTTFLYVLIFLGVSLFTRPKRIFGLCAAGSVSVCAVVAVLQLYGNNPLHLFPDGIGFFDAGIRYSGVFLGTIGNTNILDAVLCLALPVFSSLYVLGYGRWYLLPVLLSLPVIIKGGGDGGRLALLLSIIPALPLLCRDAGSLQRILREAGLGLLTSALSVIMTYRPETGLRAEFSVCALCLLAAGLGCLGLSLFSFRSFCLSRKTKRWYGLLIAFLLLFGFCVLFLSPVSSGTLYELRQTLLGRGEDSFGSSRLKIWRDCLKLVPQRLWFGGGPGTLALRLDIRFSRFVSETGKTLSTFVDNAHNVYLGTLVNTGALGLLGLLGIYAVSARNGLHQRSDPVHTSVFLGVLRCVIQEFFGLGLCLSAPLLWIALALLNATQKIQLLQEN